MMMMMSSFSEYQGWGRHNPRLRSVCEGMAEDGTDSLCYDPQFVQSICDLQPINLVKTVRMRVSQAAPLLNYDGSMVNCGISSLIILFYRPESQAHSVIERPKSCEELQAYEGLVFEV